MNLSGSRLDGPLRLAMVLTAALTVTAGGCGGDAGVGGPAGEPGSGPRLEGRYVITLHPQDYDRGPQRTAWRVTPRCDSGPCDTTARTSGAERIELRFDDDSGSYVGRATFRADCVSRRTGRLLVEDAYRDRARLTIEPLETEETDGSQVVTKFKGRSRRTLSVRREALEEFRCTIDDDQRVETDRVKGVRAE